MEEASGSARRAEQPFNFAEFLSPMRIMERLQVKVGQFSEPQTAETLGFLNQAEPRILFLEFRLPMQTTEQLWVGQLAKVKSLEQRTEASTGSASQTQERNSFSTFPLPMQTQERPLVIRAQSSERRTEETPGLSKHHIHCLRAPVHSMQSPLPMLTPEPLLATLA